MSDFETEFPTFRLVNTHHGDTLQSIAGRELGDDNRWPELIWLNSLSHPYITDDPARVSAGVLLTGTHIRVPAAAGFSDADNFDNDAVYESDCKIVDGKLEDDGAGDFAILSGVDNLSQQLSHRITTPMGQARRHPEYGCRIYRLVGDVNGPAAARLGAEYVRASLLGDYRVNSVPTSEASVVGDVVRISAVAEAVTGDRLKVTRD
jgi:hypothetical protein